MLGWGLLALVCAYLCVAGLRRWAERHQLLDIPNERSLHSRPVPRCGGIPIVMITLVGGVLPCLRDPGWDWSGLLAYSLGAGLISVVSWLDDLHSLSNRLRFACHSLGAVLALVSFGSWHTVTLPWLGPLPLGWLGVPITFLWIVGLTNAYNFMDGIDGIAGGQAVVAGVGWCLLGWQAALPAVTALGMLLAASSLGFLCHNWPPARIFMGDVGSAFLGYTFAVLSVVATQNDPQFALAGVLLVGPFVFDTTLTLVRRWQAGENVLTAHRSHLYQRLVIAGESHRTVTLLYMALAVVCVVLALLWATRLKWAEAMLIGVVLPMYFALWTWVLWRERHHVLRPSLS